MRRPYETCVVIDGLLSDDAVAKERASIEQVLKTGAEITNVGEWGKRKLTYPIKKRTMGYYYLFEYIGEGDIVAKLDRMFKLDQNVLRYLTVQKDPNKMIAPTVDEPVHQMDPDEQSDSDNERG